VSIHYLAKLKFLNSVIFLVTDITKLPPESDFYWVNEFVDTAVKINSAYYRDVLLTQQLLPVMQEISRDFFILQQDSAPVHHARDTIKLVERETPTFIAPNLWPPNSPDLNPVNYKELFVNLISTCAKCSSGPPDKSSWPRWTEAASMCSMAWDKTSSMMQLMSGVNVCMGVFVPKEDILSICQTTQDDNLSLLSLWILKENCCYCVKYVRFCYFELLYFTR